MEYVLAFLALNLAIPLLLFIAIFALNLYDNMERNLAASIGASLVSITSTFFPSFVILAVIKYLS